MFMAQTSDELCKRGVTREEADIFASLSHKRTEESIDGNVFSEEIVPVKHQTG